MVRKRPSLQSLHLPSFLSRRASSEADLKTSHVGEIEPQAYPFVSTPASAVSSPPARSRSKRSSSSTHAYKLSTDTSYSPSIAGEEYGNSDLLDDDPFAAWTGPPSTSASGLSTPSICDSSTTLSSRSSEDDKLQDLEDSSFGVDADEDEVKVEPLHRLPSARSRSNSLARSQARGLIKKPSLPGLAELETRLVTVMPGPKSAVAKAKARQLPFEPWDALPIISPLALTPPVPPFPSPTSDTKFALATSSDLPYLIPEDDAESLDVGNKLPSPRTETEVARAGVRGELSRTRSTSTSSGDSDEDVPLADIQSRTRLTNQRELLRPDDLQQRLQKLAAALEPQLDVPTDVRPLSGVSTLSDASTITVSQLSTESSPSLSDFPFSTPSSPQASIAGTSSSQQATIRPPRSQQRPPLVFPLPPSTNPSPSKSSSKVLAVANADQSKALYASLGLSPPPSATSPINSPSAPFQLPSSAKPLGTRHRSRASEPPSSDSHPIALLKRANTHSPGSNAALRPPRGSSLNKALPALPRAPSPSPFPMERGREGIPRVPITSRPRAQSLHRPSGVSVIGDQTPPPPVPPLPTPVRPLEDFNNRVRIFIINSERHISLDVMNDMTATAVVDAVRQRVGPVTGSDEWMLWEVANHCGLERPLRPSELPIKVMRTWPLGQRVNAFIVKPFPFTPAPKTIPVAFSGAVEWHSSSSEPGKWSSRYLELKGERLFIRAKDNSDDEIPLASLSHYEVYLAASSHHRPPKSSAFAIKCSQMPSKQQAFMHLFSCSKEDCGTWFGHLLRARDNISSN